MFQWFRMTTTLLLAAVLGAMAPMDRAQADLGERGYLLSVQEVSQLSSDDRKLIIEAMNEDISRLPVIRTRLPRVLDRPAAPTMENLYRKYSFFREFCQGEFRQWEDLTSNKVCVKSMYMSMQLYQKVFEQKDFWDLSKLIWDPHRPSHYDFVRMQSQREHTPHIWSYVAWYKSVPDSGSGWQTLEGYVCTENDPLVLREKPEHGSEVVELMDKMSPIIIYNYLPFMDWTYVQYGDKQGFAHTSFICMGNAREPVFSIEQQLTDHSKDQPDFYNYAEGSKCDYREYSREYVGPAGGDRRLWLNVCNEAEGTTPRWCMDMTCPNIIPGALAAFDQLYGDDVPRQLIPDAQQFGTGIELVRLVTRLEKAGLCIERISNWHRPESYNKHRLVGGSTNSFHMVEGGAKAVDILFCDSRKRNNDGTYAKNKNGDFINITGFEHQKEAARLMNEWHDGWFKGGMGVYKNTPTLHIDLRGYAARW